MSVPTAFSDLSTTASSNGGLISDATAVNVIDDHLRAVYAFIASVYANSGNSWTSPYLTVSNPSYTGTLTGGTGVINLGGGQLVKDGSGNVGIGNGSPTYRLDLSGTAGNVARFASTNASNLSLLRIAANNTTTDVQVGASGNSFVVLTGGNNRVTIDSNGNATIANTAGIPSTPTGGGVLYVNAGALYYLGSSGTSTLLAPA